MNIYKFYFSPLSFTRMPRIEADVKLDFKDVLFRPKRSTLKSRSEVKFVEILAFINDIYIQLYMSKNTSVHLPQVHSS